MENAPFLVALMINQGEAIMSWNSKDSGIIKGSLCILKLVLYQTRLFHHRREELDKVTDDTKYYGVGYIGMDVIQL